MHILKSRARYRRQKYVQHCASRESESPVYVTVAPRKLPCLFRSLP